MKANKKIIVLCTVLVLIAIAGSIAVYKNKKTKAQEESQDSNQPKIEITVWTKDRHDMEFWTKKIQEFNETNTDNILVRYQIFSDNYQQAVSNALNTNQAPDMLTYTTQVFVDGMSSYADITPYMDEEFKNTFSKVMIDDVNVINGKCYYIPTAATSCRLFYNKSIFQKAGIQGAPKTMEELIEDARIITRELSNQGIYGFAINFKNADSALNRSLFKQGNTQLGLKGGYNFKTGRFEFTTYESLVEKWRTLLSSDCAYPGCEELDIDPLRKLFAAGKIGMYMSYSHSELGAYLNQYSMEDEWACVSIPTEDGIVAGAQNYSMNNGYLFNASSENLDQAWIVYREIFANIDNLKEYYTLGLGVSVIPDVLSDAQINGILAEHEQLAVNEHERLWPSTPVENGTYDFTVDGMGQYETLRQLILGNGDIHQELTELTDRYNRAYNNVLNGQNIERIQIENFDPMNPGVDHE